MIGKTEEDYLDKSDNIFNLLNQFRSNPRQLAHHLEKLKKYLDKKTNVLNEPDKVPIQMIEGEKVFNDAIKFLRKIQPLPPLEWDDTLCKSAQEHVNDIGPKGLLTYQSSDGTEPENRITKFGNYRENLGENIDFGPNDEIDVIVSMTLDDGEIDRPHRNNLFKNDFKKIGIACGPHKTEFEMCVMDFAYEFYPKKLPEKIDLNKFYSLTNSTNININNLTGNTNNNFNNLTGSFNKTISNLTDKLVNNNQFDIKLSSRNNENSSNLTIIKEHPIEDFNDMNTINTKNQQNNNNNNDNNDNNNNNNNKNINNNISEIYELKLKAKNINLTKKIVKKKIEVFTKVTYRFENGTTREVSRFKTKIINC